MDDRGGTMLNRMGSVPKMDELARAVADIPYYRHLGGHAYKQHMAHIKNLERRKRMEAVIAKVGKKE